REFARPAPRRCSCPDKMNMQQMMTPALLAGIHIDDKTIFGKYLRHRRFTVAFYQDYNLRAWVIGAQNTQAVTFLRGLPPSWPLERAAARLAGVRALPPLRPASAKKPDASCRIHCLVPNTPATRPG